MQLEHFFFPHIDRDRACIYKDEGKPQVFMFLKQLNIKYKFFNLISTAILKAVSGRTGQKSQLKSIGIN